MISTSPFLSRLAGRIAILLAAGTLAACSVEADQGGGFNPRPRVCTAEYMPVCGARGGDTQTFANACEARSSGFRIVGQGECRRSGDREESRACTREYAPVCGARGRDRQTFANACQARSSGYDVIGRGECQARRPDRTGDEVGWQDQDGRDRRDRDRSRRDRERERPRDQRACTMEYNPVCGRRGDDFKEFGNACSAEAAGFRVFNPGRCPVR